MLLLLIFCSFVIVDVQSLSPVQLFLTPWTIAWQTPLSAIVSQSLLKFTSMESVMLSNHLILCCTLLFFAFKFSQHYSLFEWIGSWLKYWSFSLGNRPSNEYSGYISFSVDWFDLLEVQRTLKNLLQHHNLKASILRCPAFFMVQLTSVYDYWKKHSFDCMDLCQQSDVSVF